MREIDQKFIQEQLASNERPLNFSNSRVIGPLELRLSSAGVIDFTSSIFTNDVSVLIESNQAKLLFSESTFEGSLSIDCRSSTELILINTVVEKGMDLSTSQDVALTMNGLKAKGLLNFSYCTFSAFNAQKIAMEQEMGAAFRFVSCIVAGEALFYESVFCDAVFSGTTFQKHTAFDGSTFYKAKMPASAVFSGCHFKGFTSFRGVQFKTEVLFNRAQFHNYVSFYSLNYNPLNGETTVDCRADFSGVLGFERVSFDNSTFLNLKFYEAEFKDVVSLIELEAYSLEVYRTIFLKGADFLNARILNADRETYRVIKNEFLKLNNSVESLHYRVKEMRAYEKEIHPFKDFGEYILLLLNKLSNNHGLSWTRGVLFTFIAGALFFTLYLITLQRLPFSWGWMNFQSFLNASDIALQYFIRFFIVTHDLDFMKVYGPSAFSFFIDFVAKVFIGFGIYQTIQAFRKYGKS